MSDFKKPLCLDEQTKHLTKYKNIIFENISEEEAQE